MKSEKKQPPHIDYKETLLKRLKDPRACVRILNAVLDGGNEEAFLLALHDVAEAQGGISRLARLCKIHRVTLHRILSMSGNPKLENLTSILHALGLKLTVIPEKPQRLNRAA